VQAAVQTVSDCSPKMAAIQHNESPLVLLHLIPFPTTSAASLPKIEYPRKMRGKMRDSLICPIFPLPCKRNQGTDGTFPNQE
jgi:hypothetical protein